MSSVVLEDLSHDVATMARVVQTQLTTAVAAFFARDVALAEKVIEKDDHVDNLLGFIEERCFAGIPVREVEDKDPRLRQVRGVFRLAVNLEKIGDYAVNIAEQAVYVSRFPSVPLPFDLDRPAHQVIAALDEAIAAFMESSAEKAKHACRCEPELDDQYRAALAETFSRLARPGQDPAFIITNLFVSKFLERIGDSILNIGETILFILTGERLKLHQYLHLEEMRVALGPESVDTSAPDFRQIWGGISGARLGRLSVEGGRSFIWKEGAERKIEEEIREVDEWNRIIPGLVPAVHARYHDAGRESFLGHFLDGHLLRDVYVTRSWDEKLRVTARLLETLRDVWLATATAEAPRVDYTRQIVDRLPELYAFHPDLAGLRRVETRVFGIVHPSIDDLLARLARIEPDLAPKTSVRIHGDFNTNNVIYDPRQDRVHFIDVHRSGMGDYVQDVGVFVVSLVRGQALDTGLASDMARLDHLVVEFAQEFASMIVDPHFEPRLVLARARSLITSARLVTDPDIARALYLRGVRLLERAAGIAG